MKTVSMIVWNDFLNDARVLKEAETLQKSNYMVNVYAVHKNGVTPNIERLSSGVCVYRTRRNPFALLPEWFNRKIKYSSSKAIGEGYIGKVRPVQAISKVLTRLVSHSVILYKVIKSRADVIHAHDVNTLPTAWLASRIIRAKLVYDAHEVSTSREGYVSFKSIVFFFEKKLMPKADAIITTTTTRAKFFSRVYGVCRPVVLQNRPKYQAVLLESNVIREQLGIEDDKLIILYQGGLQQGRGLEVLVRAADKIDSVCFVFIGGGRLESTLKDIVNDLGLQAKVFFIETLSLDDLPSYTASADIGVQVLENTCFNHYSTDSNKLFEYAQVGLPVIASNFPEIKKIVLEYEIGMLVPPGSMNHLIVALKLVVASPELRAKWHNNALNNREELSWVSQEDKLLELYSELS